jgi:hypothetical protein
MEGIGRVRKVKSKISDSIETIVDKSKEKSQSPKAEDSHAKTEDEAETDGEEDTVGGDLKKVELQEK